MGGHLFGGQFVDVAQDQRGALARGEDGEAGFEQEAAFFAKDFRFGTGRAADMEAFRQVVEVSKVDAAVAAQMVERGVGGDAGKPMGRFVEIFQLLLTGKGLDKGVLGKVLRVGDIADDAVDEEEDALHVRLDEEVMPLAGDRIDAGIGLGHATYLHVYGPELNRHTHPTKGDVPFWPDVQRFFSAYSEYMRAVGIAGIGKTAFGTFAGRSLRDLTVEAIGKCLADAGMAASDVGAFYLGNFAGPEFMGQSHLAPFVAGEAGMIGIPCTRFENACASSGSAFYHAYAAVAAGLVEVALVAGVEKMSSQTGARVTEILAEAGDVGGEVKAGATFPALFAMIARRHMFEYGTTREQMAAVAVKNHANGALNALAHLRKPITLEQALAGKPVCDPLTVYDCSLVSDGAAAVLLTAAETGKVRVLGIAQASDYVALDRKASITSLTANTVAARKALAMAGLGVADVDLLEVHDCFTIAEILALEDMGFVGKGEGGPATAAGYTALGGAKPVNTSGGLKSKGHPVGATGVGQICDLVIQMRGQAEPERQVRRREVGLAQNLGGSGATSVVTVLGW